MEEDIEIIEDNSEDEMQFDEDLRYKLFRSPIAKNEKIIVLVEWEDACSIDESDWSLEDIDNMANLIKTFSVGILVFHDGKKIVLATSHIKETDRLFCSIFSNFIVIPKQSILKIQKISTIKKVI